MIRILILVVLAGLMTGCASKPAFNTHQANRSISPQSVVEKPQESRGETALWGGTILDTRNLEQYTQIEVLAYPLSRSERPLQDAKPLGRFIIRHPGFLEPTDFAQGRLVTVLGDIGEVEEGSVGDSAYNYPVVKAEHLHLWSKQDLLNKTSFHFGFGIGL